MPHLPTLRSRRRPRPGLITAVLLPLLATGLARAESLPALPAFQPELIERPTEPAVILPLSEVRIGMKGYGMSVFHGTEPEPFVFEVVSIVGGVGGRQTIWGRCLDPKLELSGPVQGMSGSPMYLWDDGEPHIPGQGGRLIGAFAFGYSYVKECLVGVQPIEFMRQTAERISPEPAAAIAEAGSGAHSLAPALAPDPRAVDAARELLRALSAESATAADASGATEALRTLLEPVFTSAAGAPAPYATTTLPPGTPGPQEIRPLLLPLAVGDPHLARTLAPVLAPLGLQAVAGQPIGGSAPYGTDLRTRIRPGSVLAVPLGFGDADLSTVGTVTDVLPDGTVIGFGHPMFGQGELNLPMATGYVNFVVPTLVTSFKNAGSLQLVGTLLRDEAAAVAGSPRATYRTAPVSTRIRLPGLPEATYHFQAADHPVLTPTIAAILCLQSITAVQNLPAMATLQWQATAQLSGGRTLNLGAKAIGNDPRAVLMDLLPPLASAMQNPFERLRLESLTFDLTVRDGLERGQLLAARLDRPAVRPGETVGVTVTLSREGHPPIHRRLSLQIPHDTPEGSYPLLLTGAGGYISQTIANQPHRSRPTSADQLIDLIERVQGVDRETVYLLFPQRRTAVAIGRSALPDLPSSRLALLSQTGDTQLQPFTPPLSAQVPAGFLVDGQLQIPLSVKPPATGRPR